jgi:LysR family transcriptional regulator, regulator for bpeEF and oprC
MDIVELRTFVKVVQTGSFTQAADALLSHKAQVSRVVSGLEKKLNAQLLQRNTRSLHLTELGREVYERAIAVLAATDDIEAVLAQHKSEPVGTLRITCGIEFGVMTVNAWVTQYLQRYPQVKVEVDYTSRVVDIIHEGFDLAIRLGTLSDSTLVARKLGELQYGLFASSAYLAQQGTPRSIDELRQHKLLMFNVDQQRNGWTLFNGIQTEHIDFQSRLVVNNRYALLDAVRSHLGIAALPLEMVEPTELQHVLPDWSPRAVPIHAVFASTRYLTPKVRAFIELAGSTNFKRMQG